MTTNTEPTAKKGGLIGLVLGILVVLILIFGVFHFFGSGEQPASETRAGVQRAVDQPEQATQASLAGEPAAVGFTEAQRAEIAQMFAQAQASTPPAASSATANLNRWGEPVAVRGYIPNSAPACRYIRFTRGVRTTEEADPIAATLQHRYCDAPRPAIPAGEQCDVFGDSNVCWTVRAWD